MPKLSDLYGVDLRKLAKEPEPWDIRSGLPEPGLGHVPIEDFLPQGVLSKLAGLGGALGSLKSIAAAKRLGHNPVSRAQAFVTAQRNAAKPVSEGGLGLRPDNTAQERAEAMGFKGKGYHYSQAEDEIRSLDPLKSKTPMDYMIEERGGVPADFLGTHVGTKRAAEERFYGLDQANEYDGPVGATYPVLFKNDRPYMPYKQPMADTEVAELLPEQARRKQALRGRSEIFGKHSHIPYQNDYEHIGSLSHVVPPQNLRSPFAAFDPANLGKSDLLGRIDPRLAAAIFTGTAGGIALKDLWGAGDGQ